MCWVLPKAAGPPTERCSRTQARTRSRWSLIFVKNLTIFEVNSPTRANGFALLCTIKNFCQVVGLNFAD